MTPVTSGFVISSADVAVHGAAGMTTFWGGVNQDDGSMLVPAAALPANPKFGANIAITSIYLESNGGITINGTGKSTAGGISTTTTGYPGVFVSWQDGNIAAGYYLKQADGSLRLRFEGNTVWNATGVSQVWELILYPGGEVVVVAGSPFVDSGACLLLDGTGIQSHAGNFLNGLATGQSIVAIQDPATLVWQWQRGSLVQGTAHNRIQGTVTENAAPRASLTVHLYKHADGTLAASATTDANGFFYFDVADTTTQYYVVVLADGLATSYNAKILDKLIAAVVYA